MADQTLRSDAGWILGGLAVIGIVAYLASRQTGNVMQPTSPAVTPPVASTDPSTGQIATNTSAYDTTALSNPLLSVPSSAFGGSPSAPGQYVQLTSGVTLPFIAGIDYGVGSIIHYGDGVVKVVTANNNPTSYFTLN